MTEFAQNVAVLTGVEKERLVRLAGGHLSEVLLVRRSSARLVLVQGMTHTLKQVATDDPAANMATYANPLLPVSPKLLEAIVDFVGAR